MTQRATHPAQDFQKMCKQAERDHETKKLAALLERVKQQLAERGMAAVTGPKPPLAAVMPRAQGSQLPSRSSIFER